MGAALEFEDLNALDDQNRDRGHGDQRRGLVERGLVEDELVPVIEPGHLREQRVERQKRQDPQRHPRATQHRDDEQRRGDGDHVGSDERQAPHHLAPVRPPRKLELIERQLSNGTRRYHSVGGPRVPDGGTRPHQYAPFALKMAPAVRSRIRRSFLRL